MRQVTILKFWKSVLWAVIILVLLLIPGDKIPESRLFNIPYIDKMAHFGIFSILEFLVLIDLTASGFQQTLFRLTLIVLCYAALTELLQYTTSRDPDWRDFVFDAAGIIAGRIVYWLYGNIIIRVSSRNR